MKKTCYFCKYFRGVGKVFCLYANAIDEACTPEISTRPFTPTKEWLEYEKLVRIADAYYSAASSHTWMKTDFTEEE